MPGSRLARSIFSKIILYCTYRCALYRFQPAFIITLQAHACAVLHPFVHCGPAQLYLYTRKAVARNMKKGGGWIVWRKFLDHTHYV